MARRKKKQMGYGKEREEKEYPREPILELHPDTKRHVAAIACFGLAVIFILAAVSQAGPWGAAFFHFFEKLFGLGYYLLPLMAAVLGLSFLSKEPRKLWGITLVGTGLFILSALGFIDIVAAERGGLVGKGVGALEGPFGTPASLVITGTILIVSFLMAVNRPLSFGRFRKLKEMDEELEEKLEIRMPPEPETGKTNKWKEGKGGEKQERTMEVVAEFTAPGGKTIPRAIKNYTPPPLSLLISSVDKPTIGDLQANANIIKRTLDSFGIPVEMGEVNVGPTVTRFTLKPAEGVKLSRITALGSDLALALAAHPIRIEAPIPGKSLVGIEVPNKAAAVVRLGSLFLYPEFQKGEPLAFALGRNVQGEPVFLNIDRMPHLLVAGSTGSGKSIAIHNLLISMLYKNSPEMLRMILVDPKRVELSVYDGIPHLIAPVVTDNKKAIGALRWLIHEMDHRYDMLLKAGARDIKSYHKTAGAEPMPYIITVIDELADLMTTFGHEVEGYIIRLAQMSRATGIHLIVSTQRPSVEVITGLIKANITTRIALQVASQVDSRTILDTGGAEKLLGRGDLLYISAERSKPTRLQGSFISEDEVKKVVDFICEHNEPPETMDIPSAGNGNGTVIGEEGNGTESSAPYSPFEAAAAAGDEDELLAEAVVLVKSAKKASASLLQRRLKVGYARAARLLDIMEEKGIIGPGDGAKPREVYSNNDEE
ncbi:MAG: DNA translocase FtsK [Candidatus Jorgensenbacteria bacterium]